MSRAGRLGRRCACAMAIGLFPTTVRLWIVRLWLPRCCRKLSRAWMCTSWKACCTRWCWMILNASGAGRSGAGLRRRRGAAVVRVRLEPQVVRRTAALRCGDFLRAGRTLPPPAGSAWLVGYVHGPDGRPPVDAGTQDGGVRSGHRQFRDGRGFAGQGKGFYPGDGALGKSGRLP